MKYGSGIKGRDDKLNGMEILMSEVFVKINPTDPLILLNKHREENEIDPIPPVLRQLDPMLHGEHVGILTSESRRKCGLTCQLRLT
jgi:hypothetical protein